MIQPVNKDPLSLARKSTDATREDISVGQDLLDTLRAHEQNVLAWLLI